MKTKHDRDRELERIAYENAVPAFEWSDLASLFPHDPNAEIVCLKQRETPIPPLELHFDWELK